MDVVIHTSKIRINYPNDRQQPKAFRVQVGRSTGSYYYAVDIAAIANRSGGEIEVSPEHFIDGSVTGTYFVKVSSIHYDDTVVAGVEFTINVVEPTDEVIAPIVSVY
jgi:hypothetical protein